MTKIAIGGVLCTLLMIVLTLPWSPQLPAGGIDPSWGAVLEWDMLRRPSTERDLAFGFGPLAFLYTRVFHADLHLWLLVYWSAIAILLAALLGGYWGAAPLPVSVFLLSVIALGGAFHADVWLFLVPFSAVLIVLDPVHPRMRAVVIPLVALACVGGLVKFTALLVAITTFLVIDLVNFSRSRAFPWLTVLFLGGSWSVYFAATGSWDWPSYVSSGLEITAGYAAAMQLPGPYFEVILAATISAALVMVLFLTPPAPKTPSPILARVGVAVSGAMLLFLLFKAGLVRHDRHVLATAAGLVMLSTIISWRAFAQQAHPVILSITLLTVVSSIGFLSTTRLYWQDPTRSQFRTYMDVETLWSALPSAWNSLFNIESGLLVHDRATAQESLAAALPLPEIGGTVDIYSWDQAQLIAHGLQYNPRPVFQGYSAYTPALIQRNVAHLQHVDAPTVVLFKIQTIDGRLPSLDDGASWPLLWSRYDPVLITPSGHLVLAHRSGKDREVRWGDWKTEAVTWGEPIVLPTEGDGGCAWAEVRINPSWRGRLWGLLYKAPIITMQVNLDNGESRWYRLIPGIAASGFLLSPAVTTTREFADVCTVDTELRPARVISSSFHVEAISRWFFKDHIGFRTRSLQVAGERVVPEDQTYRVDAAWKARAGEMIRNSSDCSRGVWWEDNRIHGLGACEMRLVPGAERRLRFDFGIADRVPGEDASAGYLFEVRAYSGYQWQTLLARTLQPWLLNEGAQVLRVQIDLPREVTHVALVTTQIGTDSGPVWFWGPVLISAVPDAD